MKNTGALIKNELIKILRRKSVIAVFCVILGITVIFSLLDDKDFIGERYQPLDDVIKNYMRYESGDGYTDDQSEKILIKKLSENGRNILRESKNAGVLTTEDWRYRSVCEWQDIETQTCVYQMFLDGKIDSSLLSRYAEPADEKTIKQRIKDNETKCSELRMMVINNDYTEIYRSSLLNLQKAHKENIIYYNQQLSEALPEDALKFKELYSIYNHYYYEAESLLKKAVSEGYKNGTVKCSETEGVIASLHQYNNIINQTFSREDFEKELKKRGYFSLVFDNGTEKKLKDYSEYLDIYKESLHTFYEPLVVGKYAVDNDISEMTSANSTRLNILSVKYIFFLFAFFGIFIASGSISSEFSKKTINTLVIKPVSRAKIFASKYIASAAVSLSAMFLCVFACVVFSSFRYGFSDLFRPYIYISGHSAFHLPFLIWFLYRTLIAGVGVLFLTTLSFFFSAMTKNTAASILITFGIYSALNFLSAFLPFIFGFGSQKYLISNYITVWNNAYSDYVSLGRDSLFDNIGNYLYAAQTDLLFGVILLSLLIVIMYAVSLLKFKRRDIV